MVELKVEETSWRELPAWRLRSPGLEVVVARYGAQLAAITHPGDDLNPLWQPPWPACRPDRVGDGGGAYGDDAPSIPLLAGIVGHNPCIDRFGPPWPGEDKPAHGEAGVLPWTLASADDVVRLRVDLPVAALHCERSLVLDGEELVIETRVWHDEDTPRSIEWAEHASMGGPFLDDGVEIAAGVDRAITWPNEPEPGSRFAALGIETSIDPAAVLAMPPADSPPSGDIATCRVIDGWWRARRIDLGRELVYRWDLDEFPWLCVWTQHRSRTGPPWNGRTRARGMELSTKPYPEGRPPPARAEVFHDRPATCIVPPGSGLQRRFRIAWRRL